jgi:hypothetical protein
MNMTMLASRHAVCLPRRGCPLPRFRGRRLL